ncbi:MAG TPA: FAD-dependent oxidoreductase [Chthoniobacteraceae bacterium]
MKYLRLSSALFSAVLFCLQGARSSHAETLLVEAETFATRGGWQIDTQFIESMGSPYLIAHGLGKPVADASSEIELAEAGNYRVWVRTIDWSERLGRAEGAGTFEAYLNGRKLGSTIARGEPRWTWELVGTAELPQGKTTLTLKDLTGFNGRADAVLLSNDPQFTPPEKAGLEERIGWKIPGASKAVEDAGEFDLVVIGGGYGGLGTAISAARMGAKVALVQNRPVLGGNGSSEVRVWAMGDMPPSEYRLADIIREIADEAKASPAPAEQFADERKEQVVRAEKNITLLLGHHAYGLEMNGERIAAVKLLEVETGRVKQVRGRFFADCTGHGFIAQWSGAETTMEPKERMGMSNMWLWENGPEPISFPAQPWMLSFTEKEFPYPRRGHAEWFWESGFDKHPLRELEITRDWNLLAAFSAWSAIKNGGAYAERDPEAHRKAALTWLAYIGGTRETQQILGDVVLAGADIEAKKEFPDGTALTTWTIDLHVPHEAYKHALPEHPFISKDIHRQAVDKRVGYPIPYRCFYSRNIPNLFMAGRNISVNRDALGTIRVMKTIGMMGVAVGRAAAICAARDCTPREIYTEHLDEAKRLWRLPGQHRFDDVDALRSYLSSGITAR